MTIADSLARRATVAGTTNTATGRPCKFAAIMAGLEPADRDAVEAAMRDRTQSDQQLAKVLTLNGHPIGHSTIFRHRTGLDYCTTEQENTAA